MAISKKNEDSLGTEDLQSLFDPQKPEHMPRIELPSELWQPMLESHCTFAPEIFLPVMQNLIRNPNVMSSHLFRADILYDSQKDHTILSEPGDEEFSPYTRHMKKELKPIYARVPGYTWQQTYVRQLVPRNRQLDKDLVQTCHFYAKRTDSTVSNLILYIPHIADPAEMPWYHPRVKQVAFLHDSTLPSDHGVKVEGKISVHYCLYNDSPMDQRLERTALQLLSKIHKHSRGNQAGYVKRVHHDQIVPQQRFQDKYSLLKAKYAKSLLETWAEVTDPAKHVFEDLGIAAFLIELWADMYDCGTPVAIVQDTTTGMSDKKPKFPGFVDIGCGNGLLINILEQEGFSGWGFDARKRKTWETFNSDVRQRVKEMVLVPEVFDAEADESKDRDFHNGIFPPEGSSEPPFIVSNHADELTPWTPLLAYLNGSSFIAIPCCSHNLAGARWRAPAPKQAPKQREATQQDKPAAQAGNTAASVLHENQAAETGSLKKSPAAKKEPSAYSTLCDYVTGLSNEVGYTVQKEMLRIPSTRNACLLGRFTNRASNSHRDADSGVPQLAALHNPETFQGKRDRVQGIVARELNLPLAAVREDWISQARRIAGKKVDSH